jgi:Ca2+-binding EF-hand superfamily protein
MARHKLSPELVKLYEEVFHSYEREDDSGFVQVKDVPAVMKILGITMTEQEITDILGDRVNKNENPLVSSKIEFVDFLSLFVTSYMNLGRKR